MKEKNNDIVTNVLNTELDYGTGNTLVTTTQQTTPVTGTTGTQTSTTTTTTVVDSGYGSFARQNQVISWLSYQKFENIDDDVRGSVREALAVLYNLDENNLSFDGMDIDKKDQELIKLFYEHPTYSNWKLVDYTANSDGFAAIVVEIDQDNAFVGFRGTELSGDELMNDLVYADLGLGLTTETSQQTSAAKYLATIDKEYDYNTYYLAGHSLGGNLATHALLSASHELSEKIESCYSYDGPGFSNRYLLENFVNVSRNSSKIVHFQCSFIGGLLYQPSNINDYRISSNYKNTLPNALNIHNIRYFSFDSEGNPYYKGFSFKMNKIVQPGYLLDENLEANLNTFNYLADISSQKITDKIDIFYYLWSLYGDDFMRVIIEVNKTINQPLFVCTIGTSGTSNQVNSLFNSSTVASPPRDPLIIDLDEMNGIQLTDVENGVHFDLDKNGFAEKTAWTEGNDGFLAIDRNGNGIIDDGCELFSDYVIKKDGTKAINGFDALKDFDDNVNEETGEIGDGVINEKDSCFKDLLVWVDENHNGVTDPGELNTLEYHNIKSISLDILPPDDANNSIDENSSENYYNAVVELTNGMSTKISEHWFDVKTHDTVENPGEPPKAGDFGSYGNIPGLERAFENCTNCELAEIISLFINSDNYFEKRVLTKKYLYCVAGADKIENNSRGSNIDARDLHVIESFMGRDFIGIDSTNIPNSTAAVFLNKAIYKIENLYFCMLDQFSGDSVLLSLIDINTEQDNGAGTISLNFGKLNEFLDAASSAGIDISSAIYSITSLLQIIDADNGTSYSAEFREKAYSLFDELDSLSSDLNISSIIVGSEKDEKLNGNISRDILWGDSGDDKINAGGGNDIIYGGKGDDILNGGAGDDTYYFENNHGNDIIHDTDGNNKLVFTDGISADDYNMSIDAKLGFVLIHKETGETISMPDFLTNPLNYNFSFEGKSQIEGGIEDREVMEGTEGDDYLEPGDGFNIIYGGDGNDTLAGGKDMDFMYGGNGDDLLLGRNGVNVLFGGNGNDTIYDGDDGSYLNGGDGDDFLYGGGGADVLNGGAGNDYLQGDHGGDTYIFGRGYDTDTINASSDLNTIIIHGYRASSMINTRNANNDLIINFGSADSTDCLIVDHFFDYNSNRDFNFVFDDGTVLGQYDIKAKYAPIYGTDGDDWLAIQNGDNGIIHGGAGNDGLSGGSGNDELYGEDDDDTLYGNDGNDILDGGTGNDTLCGGNGTDTYIFAKGYGNDTINEWGSDHSIVKLTDINSDEVTITDQWGSNLVVSINETEDTLVISNFKWGQATYSFEFADGAIATVNKDTWELEFSKLPDISETNEDELVQENADILSGIYADDGLTSDILTETDSTVISDISDSVSVNEDSDEVADQTDIQVMILTENMSAFANEENVFDNADVFELTDDMSMMNQLLVGSQVQ